MRPSLAQRYAENCAGKLRTRDLARTGRAPRRTRGSRPSAPGGLGEAAGGGEQIDPRLARGILRDGRGVGGIARAPLRIDDIEIVRRAFVIGQRREVEGLGGEAARV